MIVNKETLKEKTGCDYYDGKLLHSRFAYTFFRDKVLPIGNIVAFRGKMVVETEGMIDKEDLLKNDFIYSNDAINFVWEIPLSRDLFSATAFQRLFCTGVANILSTQFLKKPIDLDGDDFWVLDKHNQGGKEQDRGKCSVSIACMRGDVGMGHLGINIDAGMKAPDFAYSTNLTDEQAEEFMTACCEYFYTLAGDLFVASTKII
jgi:hypothetical protein